MMVVAGFIRGQSTFLYIPKKNQSIRGGNRKTTKMVSQSVQRHAWFMVSIISLGVLGHKNSTDWGAALFSQPNSKMNQVQFLSGN